MVIVMQSEQMRDGIARVEVVVDWVWLTPDHFTFNIFW
jgi:hypothetical protein